MASLAPDVVSDIIRRLPVKSLIRFRCLSSSVCAEIDGVDFVKDHFTRSIETETGKKLLITSGNLGDDESPFTKFYAADFDNGLREAIPLHNPLRSQGRDTEVCGSCNGLILLGVFMIENDSKETILELTLWNPFTRRYKLVPSCPVKTFHKFSSCGLGFDSTVDDYKIVMISELFDHNENKFHFPVWVFSLKSNVWRRIQDAPLVYVSRSDTAGDLESRTASFANGALYWPRNDFTLLGFELARRVFFCLDLVPVNVDLVESGSKMGHKVIDGNLYSVLRLPSTLETTTFYLLVDDEGKVGAEGSWREAFSVYDQKTSMNDHLFWPLTYSNEGDRILLSKEDKLFWYQPDKKTHEEVEIAGVLHCDRFGAYHMCQESLVSSGNDSTFDGNDSDVSVDSENLHLLADCACNL